MTNTQGRYNCVEFNNGVSEATKPRTELPSFFSGDGEINL